MLRDVEYQRRTEIDAINGYVIEKGERLKIEVKANRAVFDMLKAIEANYNNSRPVKVDPVA